MEIWIVGMQIPIFVGIFEYAFLLAMKRFQKLHATKMIQVKQNKILDLKKPPISFDEVSKQMDKWTLIFCLIYIILFSVIYWIVALNQIQSMINSLDENFCYFSKFLSLYFQKTLDNSALLPITWIDIFFSFSTPISFIY